VDPQPDVTTGELYRLIQSMDKKLDRQHSDMVGRLEYESDQEGIAHKFQESSKVHTQLETKVATEGVAREAAVAKEATEREKGDARLEARLDRIGGLVKWGGGIAVTAILTIIGWILVAINGGGS